MQKMGKVCMRFTAVAGVEALQRASWVSPPLSSGSAVGDSPTGLEGHPKKVLKVLRPCLFEGGIVHSR